MAFDLVFQEILNIARQAFRGFQDHVPDETVADYHIDPAIEDILPLDKAQVIQGAGF